MAGKTSYYPLRIWLLATIILPLTVWAQSTITFSNTYDFEYGVESGSTVISTENGYIVCASGSATEYDGWRSLKLLQVDSTGKELWKKSYGEIGKVYTSGLYGSMVKHPNGGYVLGATIADSGSVSAIAVLYRFDDNGDTLWTKKFQKNYKEIIHQVKLTTDGGYALFGISYIRSPVFPFSESPQFYLIKTDSTGILEWDTTYNGLGYGTSIAVTDSGNYILTGYGGSSGNFGARIVKVDKDGKVLWVKNHFAGNIDPCNSYVSMAADGSYYVWGCTDTVINIGDYFQVPFLSKIDTAGNILWVDYYNNPNARQIAIYQVKEFFGKILIAGAKKDENPLLLYGGWIMCMDTQRHVFWNKIHVYTQDSSVVLGTNAIYDMEITSDNGFILTGFGFNDIDSGPNYRYNQDIWLLKLDSLGNWYAPPDTSCPLPCDTTGIGNIEGIQAKIYPNPTNGTIVIELPPNTGGHSFALYNPLGELLLETPLSNTRTSINIDFPAGLYLYRITAHGGQMQTGKLLVE